MRNVFCVAVVAGALVLASAEPVRAMPPFKKAFDAKYVKPDSADAAEKAFAEAAKKVNCNVCHAGTNKKMRNDYGKAVGEFVKKTEKDPAKITEGLEAAAKVKVKPDDPGSKTFGELIAEGKLPGGE